MYFFKIIFLVACWEENNRILFLPIRFFMLFLVHIFSRTLTNTQLSDSCYGPTRCCLNFFPGDLIREREVLCILISFVLNWDVLYLQFIRDKTLIFMCSSVFFSYIDRTIAENYKNIIKNHSFTYMQSRERGIKASDKCDSLMLNLPFTTLQHINCFIPCKICNIYQK